MKSKTRINKFLPFLLAAVLCTFILSTSSCGMLFTKFVNEMTEKSNDADNAGETLLPTPTGLAVTAVTETSVSLSWNPVKNEKMIFNILFTTGIQILSINE